MKKSKNPLSAEFLYELYSTAIRHEAICDILVTYMQKEYLPDRIFQQVQDVFSNHYRTYKTAPTYSVLSQAFSSNYEGQELVNTFREYDGEQQPEVVTDMFEAYIKGVRLKNVYIKVGQLYNENEQDKAEAELKAYAEWLNGFTLKSAAFVKVRKTLRDRYEKNKQKVHELGKTGLRPVKRFYLPELDNLNDGRSLRGQLTCFLASTGVGKSHIAKHIGIRAVVDDGLNVLHFQLEGSEEEALNAYSGGFLNKNAFNYEQAKLSDFEFRRLEKIVDAYRGEIDVRSIPRFNQRISTLDIKKGIGEYRKVNGCNPDIVIIDSMDLLNDSSGRKWNAEHERSKRIAVATDLKDIADDESVWIVATYQSSIENREWLNDENNVLTEYNCAEAKGLARPCTHLISLNQSSAEREVDIMRIHIAKSRFFKKGFTFKIVTDYDNENFYDAEKTLDLRKDGNK